MTIPNEYMRLCDALIVPRTFSHMTPIDVPELSRALLTASLTVLGGITIFVAGQLIDKFFIDPWTSLIAHVAKSPST